MFKFNTGFFNTGFVNCFEVLFLWFSCSCFICQNRVGWNASTVLIGKLSFGKVSDDACFRWTFLLVLGKGFRSVYFCLLYFFLCLNFVLTWGLLNFVETRKLTYIASQMTEGSGEWGISEYITSIFIINKNNLDIFLGAGVLQFLLEVFRKCFWGMRINGTYLLCDDL